MGELTAENIAELRRLEAAATPGPWEAIQGPIRREDVVQRLIVVHGTHIDRMGIVSEGPRTFAFQDLPFIAAARNALPVLLAAFDTATKRAEVDSLRAVYWHAIYEIEARERRGLDTTTAAARRVTAGDRLQAMGEDNMPSALGAEVAGG